MKNLYSQLSDLTPEQRALFERRLREKGMRKPTSTGIQRRPPLSELPLSWAQQRLWFVQQFDPDNTAYNVGSALRLKGPLDSDQLQKALNRIVSRHESLRTCFLKNHKGEAYQKILPHTPVNIPLHDLSEESDSDLILQQRIESTKSTPVSLTSPPLQLELYRLAKEDHVLVLLTHHIVCDRWSVMVFLRELTHFYGSSKDTAPLPELPIQYPDWALWQRNRLKGSLLEEQLSYWKSQLSPPLPELELPSKVCKDPSHQGAHFPILIDARLTERIKSLASQFETSLFACLLAVFKVLLMKYCGSTDIVVGSEVANRDRTETAGLIGLLVNTLVLRTDTSGDPSFKAFVSRVKETVEGGLAHQDLPFEKLVETLNPDRRIEQFTPLFQVKFDLQQVHVKETELAGLSIKPEPIPENHVKYGLRFNIQDTGETLRGQIEYSADLFDASCIARMAQHWQTLLGSVIASPEQPLSSLSILAESEKDHLWNLSQGHQLPPTTETLHGLFETQVKHNPEAIAVVDGSSEITYEHLDQKAEQWAKTLKNLNMKPGFRVGVCLPKSADLIAILLSIHKAGGAYLPLDPDYPDERLEFIKKDANCVAVFHRTKNEIKLQTDKQSLESESEVPQDQNEESWAYVIYTSGSTGQPKGVAISHHAAATLMRWTGRHFDQSALSGVLASTSICFDLSIFEIFAPLVHGGKIILANNLLELPNLPARNSVTLINTVPSLLRQLLTTDSLPDTLKVVNLAGEPLPPDLVKDLQSRNVGAIYNLYGPSEDTTYSTYACLDKNHYDPDKDPVPIGKPIDNTVALVLDPNGNLQPTGIAGELFLGGEGLACGYLNRPDLNKTGFVSNPLEKDPKRLYRTGDRVRWMENGQLEFLGRLDDQFKIRGYRIEAGEIEIFLRRHTQIKEALVVSHRTQDDLVLLAYLVPKQGNHMPSPETLRNYLSEFLPKPMIPTLWHELEAIPQLPNGKVDKALLPTPDFPQSSHAYKAPVTTTERQLVEIWETILKIESIGVDDSFFDLGGHSLLAIQLVTSIESKMGISIPLRMLFTFPTVSGLAFFIDKNELVHHPSPSATEPIQSDPDSRYEPFPLTDIQQAYWLGRNGAFELGNIATHGYREINLHGIPHEKVQEAFNLLIRRHDMLRAVVQEDGKQSCLEQVPAFDIQVHSGDASPESLCQSLREKLSHQVFPTDQWPLFHIEAVDLGNETRRYFVSFDVLLGDAWSLQILGREMLALIQGRELPPLTLTFRDYVLYEQAQSDSEKNKTDWKYWQDQIPQIPPAPDLPLIKNPREIDQPEVKRRSMTIPATIWQAIQHQAKSHGLTASAIILSAFSEVLGSWSRKRRFTVNLTLFNRRPVHPDVDSIIGDFTSSTLVPIDQCNLESFANRTKAVQATLWEVLEHRSVSGVRIIRELARHWSTHVGAIMPVVFTSTLGKIAASTTQSPSKVVFGLSQTSQVYLDHQVAELDGELILNWDTIDELWPEGVLDAMFETYGAFVRKLAADQSSWQRHPRLISQDDHQRLNASGTQDLIPQASSKNTLHGLFFQRAKQQRKAIAIRTDDTEITYEALANHTLNLADQLIQKGVTANELVAVSIHKDWRQIVACLAILTAGAAYVPIQPSLPMARRHQILEDIQTRIVLTTEESPADWPESILNIQIHSAFKNTSSIQSETIGKASENLAYVIFTSGSTGKPKGVMIDHQSSINSILDINQRIELTPDDSVFALSSLSFDLSVYDIFGSLAAGATILIPTVHDRSEDPAYWLEFIIKHKVTVWNSVPALAQLLVGSLDHHQDAANESPKPDLRCLLLSGDWIPLSLPDAIKHHLPNAQVMSLGGATEASIWSISHPVEKLEPKWPSIPYGRPMSNQTWYVLDENLEPKPPWTPGELYIGGNGVASGYWNRPQLTAERFIPNPFDPSPYLYRTGDWGRLRPIGEDPSQLCLEFLGREDFQVKVNGHRIELGEIEATLQNHPAIKQAVVTAIGSPPELVAYVVPNASKAESSMLNHLQNESASAPEHEKLTGIELPSAVESTPVFRRQSHRQFLKQSVSLDHFSELLSTLKAHAMPRAPMPKYRYPSAGSLYAVKALIHVKPDGIAFLEAGWYRYEPIQHRLIPLKPVPSCDPGTMFASSHPVFEACGFGIFFIGSLDRVKAKYGDRALSFCLLEAGYMGQLLMENAPALDLGLCPVNDLPLDSLANALGLSPDQHFLHGMLGGAIAPDMSDRWMSLEVSTGPSLQERLQESLGSTLPAYMVPKRFQILEALPISSNGKIDRKTLPQPSSLPNQAYEKPRDEMESMICNIWAELLNVDRVGIHSDFFQLGGNSLQAIQLLSALRKKFDREFRMEQLFGALTPATQAELIRSLDPKGEDTERIPRLDRSTEVGMKSVETLTDEELTAQLNALLQEDQEEE